MKNVDNLQQTDIVSTATLLKIAERVRTVAAGIAKSKKAPLKPRASGRNIYDKRNIKIDKPKYTSKQVEVNLLLNPVALAFENGRDSTYLIVPRNANSLVFWWEKENKLFVGKKVDHPGMPQRSFLAPAKRQTRQENLKDFREEANKNIRLIIRGMAKKV